MNDKERELLHNSQYHLCFKFIVTEWRLDCVFHQFCTWVVTKPETLEEAIKIASEGSQRKVWVRQEYLSEGARSYLDIRYWFEEYPIEKPDKNDSNGIKEGPQICMCSY